MPRPKILVFQHVPYEPLGTLDPLLKEAGFRIRYVNFGRMPHARPRLERYAALIGQYGLDMVQAASEALMDYSERMMRAAIETSL